ncbi:MAG: helix-turn-helix domain-containing protein [Acidimicrobiales bacterium]
MSYSESREAGLTQPTESGSAGHPNTRQRILDIALELFNTQGYDATSIRQIAERLGFSKASIYYHFASKQDILMALHYKLHEVGREALSTVQLSAHSSETWMALLDQLIDEILEYHDLFILQERNRVAIGNLHQERHVSEHDLLEDWFHAALSDQEIPLRDRVRMACGFNAVMGLLDLVGDVFAEVPSKVLADLLREAARDLMVPGLAESHPA